MSNSQTTTGGAVSVLSSLTSHLLGIMDARDTRPGQRDDTGGSLRRDSELVRKLLLKLEDFPSRVGDVFVFDGGEPQLAIDGYSTEQITYHLEQLREMGLIDSPGSQPVIGVTFRGLSPQGHDLLESDREQTFRQQLGDVSMGQDVMRDAPVTSMTSRKVFIVHGHDNDAKNEVARFLSKIGLEEVILHERPNSGRHLLTKFEQESEGAGFAVILMTPDDEVPLGGSATRRRARQNVVFELGFFIGKLGAARVAALVKGDVEKPSDFDGVGYIEFDAKGAWKAHLAREFQAARVPFDPAMLIKAL
jgi:predicted nucleotide-binding protein